MRPEAPRGARTPLAWMLVLVWVALHVFALVLSGGVRAQPGPWWTWGSPSVDVLVRMGAEVDGLVRSGDVQRILTYAFLHAFVMHLLLIVWVFLAVGRLLESVVGSARLAIVFVVSAVTGGSAHLLFEDGLLVGASAGVFGVVGALGLWSLASHHPAARPARATALFFLVISAALFFLPDAAHAAQLGGLGGGVLVMIVLGPRRSERRSGKGTRLAAALLLALCVAAGVVQAAGMGMSGAGTDARAFLEDLEATEGIAGPLYREPRHAKEEQRADLGRRLDDLLATAWLESWEGEPAFRAYVNTWRPVAEGNVPDPFAFESALDAARRAWAPFRARLVLEAGAP